jgi:hypothetical protein
MCCYQLFAAAEQLLPLLLRSGLLGSPALW